MRKKVSIRELNSIANTSDGPFFIVNGKCNPTGIQPLANYLSTDSKYYQNYSNPFIKATQIISFLKPHTHAKLSVYSCFREELQVMVNTNQPGCEYTVVFNSSGIAAEINFFSLTTLEERELQVVLRVK